MYVDADGAVACICTSSACICLSIGMGGCIVCGIAGAAWRAAAPSPSFLLLHAPRCMKPLVHSGSRMHSW